MGNYGRQGQVPGLIEIFEWSPRTYVEPFHWHSALEIGVCMSGKGWFYFGDKTYEVAAGDVFVVNNLERHIAQSDASDPSRYWFVNFKPELFGDEDKELLLPFIYNPRLFMNKISNEAPVARLIVDAMRLMFQERKNEQQAYRSLMKGLLLQICSLLCRHYSTQEGYGESFDKVFEPYIKLQPALDFLRINFRKEIGLADMARQLNLSPSRARHLFKEIMGEGFKEYVTQLRTNEAKKLLSGTDWSVTEIYLNCGFQTSSPFYRAFQGIVGTTPQAYREQSALSILQSARSDINL